MAALWAAAVAWFQASKILRWLAIAGAVIAAAAAVRWKWTMDGRHAAEADMNRRTLDQVKEGKNVEDAVRRLSPDAVSDELRRDWSRR